MLCSSLPFKGKQAPFKQLKSAKPLIIRQGDRAGSLSASPSSLPQRRSRQHTFISPVFPPHTLFCLVSYFGGSFHHHPSTPVTPHTPRNKERRYGNTFAPAALICRRCQFNIFLPPTCRISKDCSRPGEATEIAFKKKFWAERKHRDQSDSGILVLCHVFLLRKSPFVGRHLRTERRRTG